MTQFKPTHLHIISAREGIIASFGTTGSRGRELCEREYKARANGVTNHSPSMRCIYVTFSGEIVDVLWRRGNSGDTFLDHALLPENCRVAKSYREKTTTL